MTNLKYQAWACKRSNKVRSRGSLALKVFTVSQNTPLRPYLQLWRLLPKIMTVMVWILKLCFSQCQVLVFFWRTKVLADHTIIPIVELAGEFDYALVVDKSHSSFTELLSLLSLANAKFGCQSFVEIAIVFISSLIFESSVSQTDTKALP